MNQAELFPDIPTPLTDAYFDGKTYNPDKDCYRLTTQLGKTFDLMKDGRWRSLSQIARSVSGSEAGVSARLRDMRKDRFGAHTVERKRVKDGLWLYRLEV